MKMTRILAGILATVLLAAVLTGCGGKKSLFYQASGIDPKETIASVNGQYISAEEYLYWLAYECEKLTASRGTIKWSETVEDGVTYGEYAKRAALADVMQFAVVRDMAEKSGVTLSQEDREELQKNKEEDIKRSGGREEYLNHLSAMGISEATYDHINEGHILLNRLVELGATPDSAVYPTEKELEEFSKGKAYTTVRMIALPVAGLDEEALDAQKAMLADCAQQIREASDPCAKLEELSESLGQTDGGVDQTLGSDIIDLKLMNAVKELEEGEVSDVIVATNAMCVVIRRPLDLTAIARECFARKLVEARTGAKVQVSASFKSLDVGEFYTGLVELRQELLEKDIVKK